jgi:pimeloyl-ACP methyl ester carboxylesterase
MKMFFRLIAMLLACGFAPTSQAADAPALVPMTTTDGVKFGIWPAKPAMPLPTVFILSGAWQDALGSETYRKAGTDLAYHHGYLCVSVDLPCHGEDAKTKESGLTGWRVRCDRGEDVMADLSGRMSKVLDFLIAEKLADPQRVAVIGTSRGGFSALHFAAAEPRVRCAVGYAPVTDLAKLSEFKGAEQSPLVQKLALVNYADVLATKGVWIIIGDRDVRVDTDSAITLARKISAAAAAKNLTPRVELHVLSSPGHTTPAGAPELSAAWIEQQLSAQP